MADSILDIKVDHNLWKIAQKFSRINEQMMDIVTQITLMKETLEAEVDLYEGRGREEIDTFLNAYLINVNKLANYYQYCGIYINDALSTMLEFDDALKSKFEEGVTNFIKNQPEEAARILKG